MKEGTMETGLALGTKLPRTDVTETIYESSERRQALFFVSLYCVHCVDLLPHLNSIHANHSVSVVLYSSGDKEDHEEMADYFEWGFPIVSLSKEEMESVFHVTALPFALIIDDEKRVAQKSVVYNESDFAALLERSVQP